MDPIIVDHKTDKLGRITAPFMCAGVVITAGRVRLAAPILRYMVTWTQEQVEVYCERRGFHFEIVEW